MGLPLRFILCAAVFLFLEMILFDFVDRPLSIWLRHVELVQPDIIGFFKAITDIGKSKWYLWPSGLGVLGCLMVARLTSISKAYRLAAQNYGPRLCYVFVCVAVSGLATDFLKPILGRARPVELQREGLYGFHPLSFTANWNGMPSGHATTIVTLALLLIACYPRYKFLWLGLAGLLIISRVAVNAHYLSDVIAGSLMGCVVTNATAYLWRKHGINHRLPRYFSIDETRDHP
jgi:undecaprenyl-diphosphatase